MSAGAAVVLRGDAARLPLPDKSVDEIATSPPFWGLRDYRDQDGSLAGQIGAEATPREYLETLWACTEEWARVLKPGGSLFVNLGDTYANRADGGAGVSWREDRADVLQGRRRTTDFARRKSLLGLPWRYALGCIDDLGLILRAEIIWGKVNGLPESVQDRVVRGHEQLFHFTLNEHYYSATDMIREPHEMRPQRRPNGHKARQPLGVLPAQTYSTSQRDELGVDGHPLGKMARSVWMIPSSPLVVPPHIEHARCCGGRPEPGCTDGLDHHAAWPPALIEKIILGWSPRDVCTVCGDGRRPIAVPTGETGRHPGGGGTYRAMKPAGAKDTNLADAALRYRQIAGFACACTPVTEHQDRRAPTCTPSRHKGRGHQDNDARAAAIGTRHHGDDWPVRLPTREYHFEGWVPPPSRPGIVVDPFGGTGTTGLVASVHDRIGVVADLSGDYCGLARWRTTDPGERARVLGKPKPPPVPVGQADLFSADEAV